MTTEEVQMQVYSLIEEVIKRLKKEEPEKYEQLLKNLKKEAKNDSLQRIGQDEFKQAV